MLSICFLCRTFQQARGGAEAYYYRMAKALSARGHTIHIVTQKGIEKSYCNDLGPSVFVHTIDFKELSFRGAWRVRQLLPMAQLGYSMAVAHKVKEIQKSHTIDIIHSTDWTSEGFWISMRKHAPLFVRLHGIPEFYSLTPPNLNSRLKKMMIKRMIFNANQVFSVSNDFAEFIKESIKYPKSIDVIYNGIDQNVYKPGNSPRQQSILFVGRLEQAKGMNIIAQAIPMVLRDFPDLKFIFAGKPMQYKGTAKTWKDRLSEVLPVKNLIFLGQIPADDIVACYQENLISIFPSLYEPGGTAALESMACGCATIASRVGGFKESLEDGVDGLLIPANDPLALANAIKKLLNDDSLRESLSINAVRKISCKFNLNSAVDQTIQAYKKVLYENKRHYSHI